MPVSRAPSGAKTSMAHHPHAPLGDQSREASGHMPRSTTNRTRRAGIYLGQGPIVRGERAYAS
eukprot:2758538-Pyramimonas_sp.AAC.1